MTNKNKQKDSDAVNCVGGKNMVVMEWFAATGTTVRWLKTRKNLIISLKRQKMQKICFRLKDSRIPFAATGSLQEDALLLQPGEIRFRIYRKYYNLEKDQDFVASFA